MLLNTENHEQDSSNSLLCCLGNEYSGLALFCLRRWYWPPVFTKISDYATNTLVICATVGPSPNWWSSMRMEMLWWDRNPCQPLPRSKNTGLSYFCVCMSISRLKLKRSCFLWIDTIILQDKPKKKRTTTSQQQTESSPNADQIKAKDILYYIEYVDTSILNKDKKHNEKTH